MRYDKKRVKYGSVSPRKEVAAYFQRLKERGGREIKKTERERKRERKKKQFLNNKVD